MIASGPVASYATNGPTGEGPSGTVDTVLSTPTSKGVTVVQVSGAPGVATGVKPPVVSRVVRTENGGLAI